MTAEDAAYRALAAFRIPAAERREFAAKVAAVLAEIPREYLPFQAEAGVAGGIAYDLARQEMPLTVPTARRLEVAAAAVGAAAQAMLEEPDA